jgi:hypothetical protein
MIVGKKRKRDEAEDDRPSGVKLLKTEISKAAPSFLALAAPYRGIARPGHVMARNHSFEADTLPLVLLDEAFAIFKTRREGVPSKEGLACLGALTPRACQWYASEAHRREAVQSVFREHLNLRFREQRLPGTEFHPGM